ncbi:nitrogen fixation-related uncharacterized protein [Salinibacter ruber]|jgi:nitrogen fixation-related uncharacterized protein|uniref:Cytochrome oxidase maturation protein, cbb3-type n=3 Tax=Salinibacter ruber TaxID=146919 RepID=Q2S5R4_SALRD|nr:cbb3-type cytochrome oxidase assembly protein CcoS [Salinibacter ruber]ABC43667.1 hypothetical protein SRU_0321 [Salinibacter ruber DSM 13855]MBB4061584.1 nitrogen fixation-related uncharacterized protein [Salinibacter ruber]MBB4070086.1 nitrogen fixation-related uncharacterized protein [Salinibacter ruber]MCS3627780.1 nitrogen fixation-related uncharacterized protein [Salinibacter ruber]MCS3637883.1 nitrogen fixation-related uncharacterized protein [Salinibacter ruber]
MSYTPLLTILLVLVVGAAITLTVLFYAQRKGHFDNLKSEAYVIFDDDEPVGEPQDQVFDAPDEPTGAPDPEA